MELPQSMHRSSLGQALKCAMERWAAQNPGEPFPKVTLLPEPNEWPGGPSQTARKLLQECLDRSYTTALPDDVRASPEWTPIVGGAICPNNHFVALYSAFCSQCGEPVSPYAASQGEDLTEQAHIRAGIGWYINQRWIDSLGTQ